MDLLGFLLLVIYLLSIGIFILSFYNGLQFCDSKDTHKHILFGVLVMSIIFYDMFKILMFDESDLPYIHNCPLCGQELPTTRKYDSSDPKNPFHCT